VGTRRLLCVFCSHGLRCFFVSPASPYIEGVLISVNEGPVRAFVAISVSSLRILEIGVSIANIWMVIGVATSTTSFALLCGMARFLQAYRLVVKDCKL
jgi:hypothetical protein